MVELTEYLGFAGAVLIAAAYVPQMLKLWRNKCSACMSIPMWRVWALATLLILVHAWSTPDLVFRVFTTANAAAIVVITLLVLQYRNRTCAVHEQPAPV